MSSLGITTGIVAIGRTGVGAQVATPSPAAGRTVETIHGPVTVPDAPRRIVAITFPSAVTLLELGVTPVGVTSYLPAFPADHPSADGIERVDNDAGELDIEKIISLRPDLIVGSDWADPERQSAPYEELSRIAPTALFEWIPAAANWVAEAEGVAEAIGQLDALAALRTAYEDKAATIKEIHADAIATQTWDLISANDTNWYLYGPTSSHGKVAVDAGIRLNAASDQADSVAEYSFERFDLLVDTGVLLVRSAGDPGLAVLETLPVFTGLPAVSGDHLVTSDYFFPSSYGLSMALLDDIEAGLLTL